MPLYGLSIFYHLIKLKTMYKIYKIERLGDSKEYILFESTKFANNALDIAFNELNSSQSINYPKELFIIKESKNAGIRELFFYGCVNKIENL